MDPINSNPLSILTFIAAPAILTNASSVNALSTSNRLARSMERVRAISALIDLHKDDADGSNATRMTILRLTERRTLLIVRALTGFYIGVGSFAAASLISLVGAIFVAVHRDLLQQVTLALSLVAGIVGVCGLTVGASLLVLETRMALRGMAQETALLLAQSLRHLPGDAGQLDH